MQKFIDKNILCLFLSKQFAIKNTHLYIGCRQWNDYVCKLMVNNTFLNKQLLKYKKQQFPKKITQYMHKMKTFKV